VFERPQASPTSEVETPVQKMPLDGVGHVMESSRPVGMLVGSGRETVSHG
jgi:hypothetical protein